MGETALRSETKFTERLFNDRYKVRIPEWTRIPAGPYSYEPKRTGKMAERLVRGDILFDVGLADGWVSGIYAQIVGAENMCMFEPSPEVWPNIKAIWDENRLATPMSTFCGFASDKTVDHPIEPDHDYTQRDGWPIPAFCDTLLIENRFRGIKERSNDTRQLMLDDFIDRTSIIPRALSIDVEGAETLVLKGAVHLLKEYHPLLFLSLHTVNGAIFYDYHSSEDEIRHLLRDCGYDHGTYLETWGDAHWLFEQDMVSPHAG